MPHKGSGAPPFLECKTMSKQFNVKVSYFQKGELKQIEKRVTASHVSMAWRAGLSLVPIHSGNQVQIKVDPV